MLDFGPLQPRMKGSYQAVMARHVEKSAQGYADGRDLEYELRYLTKSFLTEWLYQNELIKKYENGEPAMKVALISKAAENLLPMWRENIDELEQENVPTEGAMQIFEWLLDAKTDGLLPTDEG